MNAAGLALLKRFEGLRLTAFYDTAWTIGHGHTGAYPLGIVIVRYGEDRQTTELPGGALSVTAGDQLPSPAEAEGLLCADVRSREAVLLPKLPPTLNENERAALTCLAFNVGVGAVLNSHLLAYIRGATPVALHSRTVNDSWASWDHELIHGTEEEVAGLKARRAAEFELFCAPVVAQGGTT